MRVIFVCLNWLCWLLAVVCIFLYDRQLDLLILCLRSCDDTLHVCWVGGLWELFPLVFSLCGGSHGCVCMLGGVVLLVCCLVSSTCVVCLMALCFSLGHVVDIMLFTILLSWALCFMMLSCIVVFSAWWMTLAWVCRFHVICVVSLTCAPSFCCLALLFLTSCCLWFWHYDIVLICG